jgi:hypothetical protein
MTISLVLCAANHNNPWNLKEGVGILFGATLCVTSTLHFAKPTIAVIIENATLLIFSWS